MPRPTRLEPAEDASALWMWTFVEPGTVEWEQDGFGLDDLDEDYVDQFERAVGWRFEAAVDLCTMTADRSSHLALAGAAIEVVALTVA